MIPEKLKRFINNENLTHYRQDLDQVRALLARIGNPHLRIKTIHIAGTNGKGSVAHMLNNIFMKAGYKTGLYTSPHLLEINERIKIQNADIPDDRLEGYVDEISSFADSTGEVPTFFDILTACAFRYFDDERVDLAVIETGLGGRLDSTNVITPLCSIITSISMDHTDILGNTLTAIAGEKAGIIKTNVPVVTAGQDREVMDVITAHARAKQSELFVFNERFSIQGVVRDNDGYKYNYRFDTKPAARIDAVAIDNPVSVQTVNSAVAITAALIAREQFPGLTEDTIRLGIKTFAAPGRCQVLSEAPLVLFDPAHNEAAIEIMIKFVNEKYGHRAITLVITLMKDKKIDRILPIIKRSEKPVIYYVLDDPRCYRPPESDFQNFEKIIIHDEPALVKLLDGMKSDASLFFFTGSFRLYRTALNYAGHK
jgi:dihydrofolate synthase / folylpolyglutamate synthase